MSVITTLSFEGRTEEALRFYTEALGAKTVFLMRFRDCPDRTLWSEGMEEQVFHATFRIENTDFMASDVAIGREAGSAPFSGFALAIRPGSESRARQMFSALSLGGHIIVPLAESGFTALYGVVTDRFGVTWKLIVESTKN
jgi:PhnB protein